MLNQTDEQALQIDRAVAAVFRPLKEPARYKGLHGGRGSGKSWQFAGDAVEALLRGKAIICLREIQNSIAESVKKLIENRIEEFGVEEYFTITKDEIRCHLSGGYSVFKGMQNHTAASVKSLEGFDIAWWEEAQTASQNSLDLLIPTIRKAGSELWFSWNPNDEDDPIDQLLRVHTPEGAIVIEANWTDNPWFTEEMRAEKDLAYTRDPDKAEHIWGGAYRGLSEARIFRNWTRGEVDPPDNVVWFHGADWGFANDPTASLRCCFPDGPNKPNRKPEDPAPRLYIDYEAGEVGTPMEKLPALLDEVPDARLWPLIADSARPETIDYVKRNGFPYVRGAKKGAGSILDGISFLQSYDIIVHPRCVNLLKELARYAYKVDKQTGIILPAVEDKNNHWIDALRYAVERLHRKGKLVPGVETEEKRSDHDYGIDEDEADGNSWRVA